MEKKYLIGIDQGSSGLRVACFDLEGNYIGGGGCETKRHFPNPNQLVYLVEELQDAVVESMRIMLKTTGINPAEIAGICTSNCGGRFTAIDEDGNTPFETISYGDARLTRGDLVIEKLASAGMTPEQHYSLAQTTFGAAPFVLAVRESEPEKYARVKKWAYSQQPFIYRALGVEDWVEAEAWATGTGCYNPYTREFVGEICEALEIKPDDWLTPRLAGELCGTVSEEAAQKTGLAAGTPIFTGGNDTSPQYIGLGAIKENDVAALLGTFGVICRRLTAPVPMKDKNLWVGGGGFKDDWRIGTMVNGCGASYNWLRNNVCFGYEADAEKSGLSIYDYMNECATKSSVGSNGVIFNPNLFPSMANPKIKAGFNGLSIQSTTNDLIRAVMEGIAYDFRVVVDAFDAGVGIKTESLYVSGGMAHSDVFLQMLADVLDLPLYKAAGDLDITAARGAAMLAGIGAGIYSDLEDAVAKAVKEPTLIAPIPENVALYKKYSERYQRSVKALSENVYV